MFLNLQINKLLKPKTPKKTSLNINNRTNCSKEVLKNSTIKCIAVCSKRSSLVNNSKIENKTPENNESIKNGTIKSKVNSMIKHKDKKYSGYNGKTKNNKFKIRKKRANTSTAEISLFDNVDYSAYGDISDFSIMASPTKLIPTLCTKTSRSISPPLFFGHQRSSLGKSRAINEELLILNKSMEAKALNRVKVPKLTLEEELKNNEI